MIIWTIKKCCWAMGWVMKLCLLCMVLAFFLCFNCFTIPLFLLLWAGCKLVKLTPPHMAFYFVTAYPTWKCGPHASFLEDVRKMNRDAEIQARKKTAWMGRPWEAIFFD